MASVNSGKINVNIIYNMSRLKFISKLPYYMKGTHIKLKGIEKLINNTSCEEITITPLSGKMRLCTDGEISDAEKTRFCIVKDDFKFVLPKKCEEIVKNKVIK